VIKIRRFKSLLSLRQKLFIKYLLSSNTGEYYNISNKQRKVIVALAADYGNLGDVAITYAQTKFLQMQFPNYEIIEFPISKTFTGIKSLKKICTPQDIITIVGGGNTGDMYDDIEYCRQFIIHQFPQNKIISFPQTVDFSDTKNGQEALQRAMKVYNKHKNLILIAREKVSFERYKKYFKMNQSILLPDIVLNLNETSFKYKRQGITLCLRSDEEKKMNKSQGDLLIKLVKQKYKIKYYDTHINRDNLSIKEREIELNKIWTAFKQSKVVITDRLHGMIFCAITKTPCVVIDNSNHKISGVYNAWLKDVGYIKMMSIYDLDELQKSTDFLMDIHLEDYPDLDLSMAFQELVNAFKKDEL